MTRTIGQKALETSVKTSSNDSVLCSMLDGFRDARMWSKSIRLWGATIMMVDCVCELLEQVQSWQTVVDELVVFLWEVIAESESHFELLLRCIGRAFYNRAVCSEVKYSPDLIVTTGLRNAVLIFLLLAIWSLTGTSLMILAITDIRDLSICSLVVIVKAIVSHCYYHEAVVPIVLLSRSSCVHCYYHEAV